MPPYLTIKNAGLYYSFNIVSFHLVCDLLSSASVVCCCPLPLALVLVPPRVVSGGARGAPCLLLVDVSDSRPSSLRPACWDAAGPDVDASRLNGGGGPLDAGFFEGLPRPRFLPLDPELVLDPARDVACGVVRAVPYCGCCDVDGLAGMSPWPGKCRPCVLGEYRAG